MKKSEVGMRMSEDVNRFPMSDIELPTSNVDGGKINTEFITLLYALCALL